jgi:hypothetical protein
MWNCRGIITATSQAKLIPPPPPTPWHYCACVGASSHMCLCFRRSTCQLKYMYSTSLALSLCYHVCTLHTGDPTFTRSLYQLANHGPTESATGAGRCHGPPARLLRQFAPVMVRLHRRNVRCHQNHAAAHEVPLGLGETPVFADRHRLPAVQGPHRLQRPVQGAAGAPPALLRPQRRPDDE